MMPTKMHEKTQKAWEVGPASAGDLLAQRGLGCEPEAPTLLDCIPTPGAYGFRLMRPLTTIQGTACCGICQGNPDLADNKQTCPQYGNPIRHIQTLLATGDNLWVKQF